MITSNTLILTATPSLAEALKPYYQPGQVTAFDAFKQSQVRALTKAEEAAIWEACLDEQLPEESLLDSKALASAMQHAYTVLQVWQHNLATLIPPYSEDVAFFVEVANQFEAWCQREGYITLDAAFNAALVNLPITADQVLLLGFGRSSPQLELLKQRIKKLNIPLTSDMLHQATIQTYHFNTTRQERHTALRFLAEQAHAERYALIVPDLHTKRQRFAEIAQQYDLEERLFILAPEEAVGINFAAIWVLGEEAVTVNQPLQPTPFLPWILQQHYQMPYANRAYEASLQQENLATFARHTKLLIFSHIQPTPELEISTQPRLKRVNAFEQLAPPVSESERSQLKGGATLLKEQALCPFRAFAHYRLQVKSFPQPQNEEDSKVRGVVVHDTLAALWQQLNTQTHLLSLSETELDSMIDATLKRVLARTTLTQSTLALEQELVHRQIKTWFQFEKQREPFQVLAHEKPIVAELGNLPLKLRIDRIDQLADGSIVLLDYKTGEATIYDWFAERLINPQLPLYAVLENNQGVAFAQIRPNGTQLLGLCHEESSCTELKSVAEQKYQQSRKWQELLRHWHSQLLELAEEFLRGEASVKPIRADTCQYCDLGPLCRIKVIRPLL